MKSEQPDSSQESAPLLAPAPDGDIPTVQREAGSDGSFGLQDDADRNEVGQRLLSKVKQKIKQVYALESKLPFYLPLAFDQSNRDVAGVPSGMIGNLYLAQAPSYKYFFVFHKQESGGGEATGEVHEEDLSKFDPKHVENGGLFRHLYPRRPVFLDGSWTAVSVFQKKDPDNAVKELLTESLPFAKGANLEVVLNSFKKEGYTQVYHGSRSDVHTLIQESLTQEIQLAPERAKNLVGPIIGGVIFTAAFGAPAVYLAWHSAMGLASNFGGEVAGAVILGLIALSILVALGGNSRKHACYTQVGNKQYLRSHLGQTLFDIHEGREPTHADPVEATVV